MTGFRAQVMGVNGWVDGSVFAREQDAVAEAAEFAERYGSETQVVIEDEAR